MNYKQRVSDKLDDKGRETLAYLDKCIEWYNTAEEMMLVEADLRGCGVEDIAEEVREEKCAEYRKLMHRRLFVADLIKAARMSPRHKRLMTWRYIKCWKWRTIYRKNKRTQSWALALRLEAVQAMAMAFDRIVADDWEYTTG